MRLLWSFSYMISKMVQVSAIVLMMMVFNTLQKEITYFMETSKRHLCARNVLLPVRDAKKKNKEIKASCYD